MAARGRRAASRASSQRSAQVCCKLGRTSHVSWFLVPKYNIQLVNLAHAYKEEIRTLCRVKNGYRKLTNDQPFCRKMRRLRWIGVRQLPDLLPGVRRRGPGLRELFHRRGVPQLQLDAVKNCVNTEQCKIPTSNSSSLYFNANDYDL